jgi:hypothetical protein
LNLRIEGVEVKFRGSFKTQATVRTDSLRLPSFFAPLREQTVARKGAKEKRKTQRTISGFEMST